VVQESTLINLEMETTPVTIVVVVEKTNSLIEIQDIVRLCERQFEE
jgi:hypothetical protein